MKPIGPIPPRPKSVGEVSGSRTEAAYHPPGLHFFDMSERRQMLLVDDDCPRKELAGWLLYWNAAYGNWVTLRKATDEDRFILQTNLCIPILDL